MIRFINSQKIKVKSYCWERLEKLPKSLKAFQERIVIALIGTRNMKENLKICSNSKSW